jgi:hypothetical protein
MTPTPKSWERQLFRIDVRNLPVRNRPEAIRIRRRFSLVSTFLALITHQMESRLKEGAKLEKKGPRWPVRLYLRFKFGVEQHVPTVQRVAFFVPPAVIEAQALRSHPALMQKEPVILATAGPEKGPGSKVVQNQCYFGPLRRGQITSAEGLAGSQFPVRDWASPTAVSVDRRDCTDTRTVTIPYCA